VARGSCCHERALAWCGAAACSSSQVAPAPTSYLLTAVLAQGRVAGVFVGRRVKKGSAYQGGPSWGHMQAWGHMFCMHIEAEGGRFVPTFVLAAAYIRGSGSDGLTCKRGCCGLMFGNSRYVSRKEQQPAACQQPQGVCVLCVCSCVEQSLVAPMGGCTGAACLFTRPPLFGMAGHRCLLTCPHLLQGGGCCLLCRWRWNAAVGPLHGDASCGTLAAWHGTFLWVVGRWRELPHTYMLFMGGLSTTVEAGGACARGHPALVGVGGAAWHAARGGAEVYRVVLAPELQLLPGAAGTGNKALAPGSRQGSAAAGGPAGHPHTHPVARRHLHLVTGSPDTLVLRKPLAGVQDCGGRCRLLIGRAVPLPRAAVAHVLCGERVSLVVCLRGGGLCWEATLCGCVCGGRHTPWVTPWVTPG
jgi:hypothetical protein